MASCLQIFLFWNALLTLQCATSHPFVKFNDEFDRNTIKSLQFDVSTTERPPTKIKCFELIISRKMEIINFFCQISGKSNRGKKMALAWKICWISSALLILQCATSHPFEEFNDEFDRNTIKLLQFDVSTTERAPTKKVPTLPMKREHWAILGATIALCFALVALCRYMWWPNFLRCCGCKGVQLQPRNNLQNRELKPQYSWDSTNHI